MCNFYTIYWYNKAVNEVFMVYVDRVAHMCMLGNIEAVLKCYIKHIMEYNSLWTFMFKLN